MSLRVKIIHILCTIIFDLYSVTLRFFFHLETFERYTSGLLTCTHNDTNNAHNDTHGVNRRHAKNTYKYVDTHAQTYLSMYAHKYTRVYVHKYAQTRTGLQFDVS